jgi:arginase
MGQRRDGLGRVTELGAGPWDRVDVPEFLETEVEGTDEKIRRMGRLYASLSELVGDAVRAGSVPVSIAGDCVSALGVLAGLQRAKRQPDRLVWFDAHGDFHTWDTTLTSYIGGMPLAMLVGRGDQRVARAVGLRPYSEERVILSDGRDLDPGETESLMRSRIPRCDVREVPYRVRPEESIHLHWDTDVVDDPTRMPALKYHVAGGPSYDDMGAVFRSLAHRNIVAISVSAWHEEQDRDNTTALAALALLGNVGVPM